MTIQFIDRPCGSGKTSDTIASLDCRKRYFIVVPTLSEVQRYMEQAPIPFEEPTAKLTEAQREFNATLGEDDQELRKTPSKSEYLKELIDSHTNIVTTHALFDVINMRDYDLSDYHLIIDEVFDCVKHVPGPTAEEFQKTYLDGGLATTDEAGKVTPTEKWIKQGDGAYRFNLLNDAMRGRLYHAADGYYVTVVPTEMFTQNRSCTVMTYLAEGSLMAFYLDKHGISYEIARDIEEDRQERRRARQRLEVDTVELGVVNKKGGSSLGYKRQGSLGAARKKSIAIKLKNMKARKLQGIPTDEIMLTCRKDLWFDRDGGPSSFAVDSRFSKAPWVHKSTKGTNEFRHCIAAVHLYDLHLNPSVVKFLGLTPEQEDAWRTSEIVQWVYRSRIRNRDGSAGAIKVIFASSEMATLLRSWVEGHDLLDDGQELVA